MIFGLCHLLVVSRSTQYMNKRVSAIVLHKKGKFWGGGRFRSGIILAEGAEVPVIVREILETLKKSQKKFDLWRKKNRFF